MVAIIPAAGKGTRMASVTGGKPKELLKLGRQTVLERIVAEAREAGVDRIVVVGAPDKPDIDAAARSLGIEVAIQLEPRGVADAIAAAKVEQDALLMMGDSVFHGGSPVARMAELIHKGIEGCIAVERVPEEHVSLYGIVEIDEGTGGIRRIVEKPKPEDTKSRWAVSARYALAGHLMSYLMHYCGDPLVLSRPGEVNLTRVLMAAIADGADMKAVALQPGQTRVDCGSPEEYDNARRMQWQ
jgi:UTP-glucose-1-phosphate uridylyltransferase